MNVQQTLIQKGQFSRLSFLTDKQLLLSHEKYYGYLYFFLDTQGKPTDDLLKEIIEYKDDSALAFAYAKTFSIVIINHIKSSEITSILQAIRHKIHRPYLIKGLS